MTRLNHHARVLLPLGVAVTLSLTGDATLYAVLPSHTASAGITVGALGAILGVNRLIRIFLNSPVGALYDRVGRRRLFVLAMLLAVISTGAYAVVEGFWPLLLARLVWGMAWALILVGGYAIVLDISDETNRGRVTGWFQMPYFLGGLLGVLLGGFLTDIAGYRPALLVCTALTAVGGLAALLALPETAPWLQRPSKESGNPHLHAARACLKSARSDDPSTGSGHRFSRQLPAPAGRKRLKSLLRTASLWGRWMNPSLSNLGWRLLALNYVNLAVTFAGNGVLMSTLGLLLRQRVGDRTEVWGVTLGVASLTALLLATRPVLSMTVAPISGLVSDRLGSRWPVARTGLLICLAGFTALVVGGTAGAVVSGVLMIALSGGVILPSLTALVGDSAPLSRQGFTMGTYAAAGDIGSAAGPFLAYAIAARLDLRWAYLAAALALLSALIVLEIGRRSPEEQAPWIKPGIISAS